MKKIALGILITFTLTAVYLWNKPCYVQPCISASVASSEIKRAMRKMGPMKDYRVLIDGKLQVMVNGQWLYLRY